MARLAQKGIEVYLPRGWEGRIFQHADVHGVQSNPVAQFATFPIPATTADFGGGATPSMRPDDIFVVLFEYGQESLGKALFARQGMPRDLTPDHFHTYTLKRGIGGHSGTQWFFTEQRRPWALYAVLGSHARRHTLVPKVNLLLKQVTLLPKTAAG
ncbi:MAG TPA: hypothetical protein VKV06_17280 [Acidimicrobiales bacterium]|nr:hypothetical protein [Acidimicrobiales bacterium]